MVDLDRVDARLERALGGRWDGLFVDETPPSWLMRFRQDYAKRNFPQALRFAATVRKNAELRIYHMPGEPRYVYHPEYEYVRLPNVARFVIPEDYCWSLLHELAHSTAHERRLNRPLGKRHGDYAYAFEEVIAETTAVYLAEVLGVPARGGADYITYWLKRCPEGLGLEDARKPAREAYNYLIRVGR